MPPNILGMDKNRFNKEVRSLLIEIPIGKQGIAFDRIDLDNCVNDYKSSNGRPPRQKNNEDIQRNQNLSKKIRSDKSAKLSTKLEFAIALKQISLKKNT